MSLPTGALMLHYCFHFSAAGLIPYRSRVNHVDPVGLTDNDLCGRTPLTRESYERLLWSRPADIYLSAEPPASPAAAGPDDDPIMETPYMTHLLGDRDPTYGLSWRHPRFGETTRAERRVFLHRRMRLLRDEWIWVGEDYSEPLWRRLQYRLFVCVRRESPFRDQLIAALRPIAAVPAAVVDLTHLEPRRQ